MENTETLENTAETLTETNPAETTKGETATYNTDEIFGVETKPETTGETLTGTEPTTALQTIVETTAYTGVTAEQFEEYQHNTLAGTGYIIFILSMILGAIIGWGFSKIWKM